MEQRRWASGPKIMKGQASAAMWGRCGPLTARHKACQTLARGHFPGPTDNGRDKLPPTPIAGALSVGASSFALSFAAIDSESDVSFVSLTLVSAAT